MPSTTARGLAEQFPIQILALDPAPPKRTLYMLTHKSPSGLSAANTELFRGYLRQYLGNFADTLRAKKPSQPERPSPHSFQF